VLAARIDRLPPDEKRLLQSASVLRKDVPVGLLHAIADLSDDGLRQGLAHLQVAEFLYETHLFPNLEYTFKHAHALTLEVTYQSLLHERRRALHARVVDAIERLFPDRLIEQIGSSASAALSGTSMAAPHVAGAAALYLEANPSATPETVRQVLIENATRDQVENSGPGSPNYLLYTGFVVGDPERFATSPQSAMRRSTDRRPDPQAHHRPRNRGNSTTRRGPATNRCRVPI
jgi:subtilisin family serine protease